MARLDIVRLGHPALRTPAEPVAETDLGSAGLAALIEDMIETMRSAEGVGLAAPQVARPLQVFVYEIPGEETRPPARVVVNPMVEPEAGELVWDWEGCLSIPGLRGLVPRHPEVRVRGLDRHGEPLDFLARGYEARIIQHEFDHLNGIVYLDRMRDLQSLAFEQEWSRYLQDAQDAAAGRAQPA